MRQLMSVIAAEVHSNLIGLGLLPPYLNWLQNVAVGFSLKGEQVSYPKFRCLNYLVKLNRYI